MSCFLSSAVLSQVPALEEDTRKGENRGLPFSHFVHFSILFPFKELLFFLGSVFKKEI